MQKMRPLIHLGIGQDSLDYQLYEMNESLYDWLSQRGDDILENGKKEFMGNYYNNLPLPTYSEIKSEYENLLIRKKRLEELKAPKKILDDIDQIVIQLYNSIQNKKYGSMSDLSYKKYRNEYYDREKKWDDSTEKENLLKEIYSFNEAQFNKLLTEIDNEPI